MPVSQTDVRDRSAAVRRVLVGLLAANLAVVAAKLAIGLSAGSLAVVGDALHSTVDVLSNILGLVVIRVAARGPDEDHPYGHGKFETLGALAIVVFLSVTCFELMRGAVNHLAAGGHPVLVTNLGFAILGLTLVVNILVAWYERRRGQALQSELLLADAAHTQSDVYITVGVIVGVVFARRGWWWVDPVVAIAVALIIVRVAYQIFARNVPVLVDERAAPFSAIRDIAEGVAGVKSAYGIRSRGGGAPTARYAEITIGVDGAANVADAHAIADAVEARLKHDLDLHEVVVHVEPC
ncbi:MAG TPA: cation diffusion facilitator family transporter [Gemmatimonadales bacterium]|nr:cation diffusion facilitator family transporter [Gemmatimonadales bacterium]